MVNVLASSAIDLGFEPDRVKPMTIKLVHVFSDSSPLSAQNNEEKEKSFGVKCPSGTTCL